MPDFWELLGLSPSGQPLTEGGGGAAAPAVGQAAGAAEGSYHPQDVSAAQSAGLGQLAALLLAGSQRQTPAQRAQYLGQIGGIPGDIQKTLLNAAQQRLVTQREQIAQRQLTEQDKFAAALKSNPAMLQQYGLDAATAQTLPNSTILGIVEAKAKRDPLETAYKASQIKEAEARAQSLSPAYQGQVAAAQAGAREQEAVQQKLDVGANAAKAMLPMIDRASEAYARADKAGAVGPYVGSAAGQAFAKYAPGMGDINKAQESVNYAHARLQAIVAGIENRGLGQVSDFERRLYAAVQPSLSAGNVQEALQAFTNLRKDAENTIYQAEHGGQMPQGQGTQMAGAPNIDKAAALAELRRRGHQF